MESYSMNPLRLDVLKRKEKRCPTRDIPSMDTRRTGATTPPRKSYSSKHTIAPAYNKGPLMVIPESCIKDIGR